MISQGDGIVAYLIHQVYDVFPLGYGPQCSSLNKVTAGYNAHIGIGLRKLLFHGGKLGIPFHRTMHIVFIEDHHGVLILCISHPCKSRHSHAQNKAKGYDLLRQVFHFTPSICPGKSLGVFYSAVR